jgi:hypothetical protein
MEVLVPVYPFESTVPPNTIIISSNAPSSHKKDATRISGISIEGPMMKRSIAINEESVLSRNDVAASFGARLLSLLFESPENVATVLSEESKEGGDEDGKKNEEKVEVVDIFTKKKEKPCPKKKKNRKQKGDIMFDGILQYLRLSSSPFRLDLIRMLTSTIRHVAIQFRLFNRKLSLSLEKRKIL